MVDWEEELLYQRPARSLFSPFPFWESHSEAFPHLGRISCLSKSYFVAVAATLTKHKQHFTHSQLNQDNQLFSCERET